MTLLQSVSGILLGTTVVLSVVSRVSAQTSADAPPQTAAASVDEQVVDGASADIKRSLNQQLAQRLTGATLVGHFTDEANAAADAALVTHEERYEITRAEKMGDGNLWLLQARIQYGDKDVNVPVPLVIQWANETPVIVLDNVTIPGLGTFDARVVLTKTRYAGTWQHDDHGGHLFGRIESASNTKSEAN